jgi:hypothetical protein
LKSNQVPEPLKLNMTTEVPSKDDCFKQVGELAEVMIAAYGKEFAMGTLILAARFIAEGKPIGRREEGKVGQ